MWLFTKDGFYSAVASETIEDNQIMVRGRNHQDLQNLLESLGLNEKIFITPEADYLFRVIIPREHWVKYVAQSAQAIDYDNFKNAACKDEARLRAYHGVWHELRLWEGQSKLGKKFKSFFGKG